MYSVCALLALEHSGLTLFRIVSLLLVMGTCIDYSLFFSHHGQGTALLRQTVHAVLVWTGSAVLVSAMLALSSVPVPWAIGLTVTIVGSASFILTVSLAPLLSGRGADARVRKPGKKSTASLLGARFPM
jgi:predicted exporter